MTKTRNGLKNGLQGLKLCFENDLTNPAIWSDILNSTVQKNSKCSDISQKWSENVTIISGSGLGKTYPNVYLSQLPTPKQYQMLQ